MRIQSKPVEEHAEVPLADEGRLEAVTEQWNNAGIRESHAGAACWVVSCGTRRTPVEEQAQLAEILGLVEAHGDTVVGHETVNIRRPDPKTYLGPGTCAAIAARAKEAGATLLVVDVQLSPSQTRNLEDATGLPISDREIVILGVFERHARSRAARIQIELAHLAWLRPRIRGLGLDMDQQAGGVMGSRGSGDTASELLARQLDDRMVHLRRAAAKLERAAALRRQGRDGCERIALVGYTNAGKTSLMNALTGADLSARSRPFETLDTTSRSLTRRGGEVLLSDTVGFIRDLPERLLASFATTLAEAREASLLVRVVDLSDPEWRLHLETTEAQIEALGAGGIPRFYALNKLDGAVVPVEDVVAELDGHPFRALSSFDADAVDALRTALIEAVRAGSHAMQTLFVPYSASAVTAEVYRSTTVCSAEATDTGLQLVVEGPKHVLARLASMVEGA
ncbi:MAG: GTPase HflX [Alphaproteobacteria bacterium]|nr:GTPase HflX [Alphaproteobacteria bacterium]